MSDAKLTLISHSLCPDVQRAAIDLDAKSDWFLAISPLGNVSC